MFMDLFKMEIDDVMLGLPKPPGAPDEGEEGDEEGE